MNKSPEQRWIGSSLVALMSLMAAGCTVLGGAQADSQALESDIQALQEQLAAAVPVQIVQAGQLAPPPPNVQPSGWDTEESLRSGLRLLATYDSGGPDAWDVEPITLRRHPLVFFTSEG